MNAEPICRCIEEQVAIAADSNELFAHVANIEKEHALFALDLQRAICDELVSENDDLRARLKDSPEKPKFDVRNYMSKNVAHFCPLQRMNEEQILALKQNEEITVCGHYCKVEEIKVRFKVGPKRPANVLEKEIIVAGDDNVLLSMDPGADESLVEAKKFQEDVEGGSGVDLTERETKRPRVYNGAGQSEEEKDKGDDDDDDDDDEEEEEEDGDEEYSFAPYGAANGSGCLKIKASVIDSSLLVSSKIGAGGYGAVYKAVINGEEVAIKILHSTSADPSEYAKHFREFETEVDILGMIKHPNLVRLIGSCKKRRAIVYEYLSNGTLEELIQIHKRSFHWKARVSVAYSICEALVFLHSRSDPVVHGDLKPSNILFDSCNVVKLGDFGISRILKLTSGSGTRMHVTLGLPKGTRNYVDPDFKKTGQLTWHSDTYAFGVIVLQLVTGKTANDLIGFVESGISLCQSEVSDIDELIAKLKEVKLIDIALRKNLSDDDTLDAFQLLTLGLECCRSDRRERPNLIDEIFPRLKLMNDKLKQK